MQVGGCAKEEPSTATEADLAGPWRIEPLPEEVGGGFGLFREGERRSPRSFASFLEACGKVALDRAGAILADRLDGQL